MSEGSKPLAMFLEPLEPEFDYFPEADFDALVSQGKFLKRVRVEDCKRPDGTDGKNRRVIYSLQSSAWRIDALFLVLDVYSRLTGWRPDLDRIIGDLLGYDLKDTEQFLSWMSEKK